MLAGTTDIRLSTIKGHEKLEAMAFYTQLSIEQLKAVHAQIHPAEVTKNPQDKPQKDC